MYFMNLNAENNWLFSGSVSRKFKIEMGDSILIISSCLYLVLLYHFSWMVFFVQLAFLVCVCMYVHMYINVIIFYQYKHFFINLDIWISSAKCIIYIFHLKLGWKLTLEFWNFLWPKQPPFPELCFQLTIWLGDTSPSSFFFFFLDNSCFILSKFSLILYCDFPLRVTTIWKSPSCVNRCSLNWSMTSGHELTGSQNNLCWASGDCVVQSLCSE